MRILVFGAGALGIPFAALLAEAGNEVTLVARSNHDTLVRDGLRIRRRGQPWRSVRTSMARTVGAEPFELAVVLVRSNHLEPVLDQLANAPNIQDVLVMVQNAGGYDQWTAALGDRLVVGFAGAAGNFIDQAVEYDFAPRFVQPTTIGEPTGGGSERCERIAGAFESAGIPTWICSDMNAWHKWHVAWITAMANSAQHAHGDLQAIRSASHRRLTIAAIHQATQALSAAGVPVQPPRLGMLLGLPQPVHRGVLWLVTRLPLFEARLLPNAMTAEAEALACGNQLLEIGLEHGVDMSAWQQLLQR